MRAVRWGRSTALLALLLPSCGGGGSPTGPATPPPVTGNSVPVLVFHDDNGDGRLDVNEGSRIPEVRVRIGGRTGSPTDGAGRATVTGVPDGDQQLDVVADSLPPFFRLIQPAPPVHVPATEDVPVALELPIGPNNARTYVAYGDSITLGLGSSDGKGYRGRLEDRLRGYFGDAVIFDEARDANAVERGLRLIDATLQFHRPAYVLIMLGTNDWHDLTCQRDTTACPVVPDLRGMIQKAKANQVLPIVATIPPTNPAINDDRNRWNETINAEIKAMAAQEHGVVVADVYAALKARGDLAQLYDPGSDVHFNDTGYGVIAEAWFQAITHGSVQ